MKLITCHVSKHATQLYKIHCILLFYHIRNLPDLSRCLLSTEYRHILTKEDDNLKDGEKEAGNVHKQL